MTRNLAEVVKTAELCAIYGNDLLVVSPPGVGTITAIAEMLNGVGPKVIRVDIDTLDNVDFNQFAELREPTVLLVVGASSVNRNVANLFRFMMVRLDNPKWVSVIAVMPPKTKLPSALLNRFMNTEVI